MGRAVGGVAAPVMFGRFGCVNTSKGADVTVVKYGAEKRMTRSCWMQPATMSWLKVTVPAATALAVQGGRG